MLGATESHFAGFETVHASLSIITCTPCPRFHADHVELRCLCTYVGEGTYFVPNKAVNRHNWMRALGIHDTNGFAVKTATSIQQASEWDVLVLKGEAFPGNQGNTFRPVQVQTPVRSSTGCQVVCLQQNTRHMLAFSSAQCSVPVFVCTLQHFF